MLFYLILGEFLAAPDHVVDGLVEELNRKQLLDQAIVAEHRRFELGDHLESSDQLHLVRQVFIEDRQNGQNVVLVGGNLQELSVYEEQVLDELYPEGKAEPRDFFDQHGNY